jgi:hypothetical protein
MRSALAFGFIARTCLGGPTSFCPGIVSRSSFMDAFGIDIRAAA